MIKLLEGMRVVEVSSFMMGPIAGRILADWGAEVIKIEPAVKVTMNPSTSDGDRIRGCGKFTVYSRQSIVYVEPADDAADVDAAFEALKQSIGERGQEIPVLLRAHASAPGRFQAAFGHRRIRARGRFAARKPPCGQNRV